MLLGLIVDWGGTGAIDSGIATPYTLLTPTYYFGKGFGDLPDSAGWLRAFAVTGQIGYQIPTRSFDVVQQALHPAGAGLGRLDPVQHAVPEIGDQRPQLPDFINHLIPIVEAQMSTPAANNFGNSLVTTGTINPGVIWVGSYFQVGLEAQVPVNRAERPRRRRARAVASLSRRHVPEDHRPAAPRRHVGPAATAQLLRYRHAKIFSSSSRCSSSPLAPTAARAHAFLDHASPLVGSTVPSAPHEVVLTFTQNLEAGLQHRPGHRFERRQRRPGQGASQRQHHDGRTERLGPGSYKVHWHALSVDTHTTEGSFTLHVGGH